VEVSGATLTNFYALHVAILPLTMMGIVSFHIWRVRKDTLTIPHKVDGALHEPKRQGDDRAAPGFDRGCLCAGDDGLILMWAVWVNAPLEGAANPDSQPESGKGGVVLHGLAGNTVALSPDFWRQSLFRRWRSSRLQFCPISVST
jgi:hypothetical protein